MAHQHLLWYFDRSAVGWTNVGYLGPCPQFRYLAQHFFCFCKFHLIALTAIPGGKIIVVQKQDATRYRVGHVLLAHNILPSSTHEVGLAEPFVGLFLLRSVVHA